MKIGLKRAVQVVLVAGLAVSVNPASASENKTKAKPSKPGVLQTIQGGGLTAGVVGDGSYFIRSSDITGDVLHSDVEATVDGAVLRSTDYPNHEGNQADFRDEFGSGTELTETNTGLIGKPDLILQLRFYKDQSWGDVQVKVVNTIGRTISVSMIRSVHATGGESVHLEGRVAADRILSDSYSEDRPALKIRDLGDGPDGVHRAVGSQLIYNRESKQSLFLGALTSDRLLTIFHLKEEGSGGNVHLVSYDAESTGTTEIMKGESLSESPAAQQVELKLPVAAGESQPSERLMFAVGSDYHEQLETYGHVVGSCTKLV